MHVIADPWLPETLGIINRKEIFNILLLQIQGLLGTAYHNLWAVAHVANSRNGL